MKDKIYLIIMCGVFLFVLTWCPLMLILNKTGAFTLADNRNYINPKVYEDGVLSELLNKIEEGKASLENMYTNYLPAYDYIVQSMRDA